MKSLLFVLLVTDAVRGILRHQAVSKLHAADQYSCTPLNGTRSDMNVDVFTSQRMPTVAWPTIAVETATSYSEFMCGIQNRNITPNCMCGYLFPWNSPQSVNMYFRAVSFNSEVYFLDSIKRVLSYQAVPALSQQQIVSVANTQYILVTQAGMASKLGIEVGDAANFTLPPNAYVGSDVTGYDDRVGMHD
jgi:uncharacterized membrane protein (UPF0127 family)